MSKEWADLVPTLATLSVLLVMLSLSFWGFGRSRRRHGRKSVPKRGRGRGRVPEGNVAPVQAFRPVASRRLQVEGRRAERVTQIVPQRPSLPRDGFAKRGRATNPTAPCWLCGLPKSECTGHTE